MSQMEHDYRELQSGRWAEINPSKCPCRGTGWFNSDLDTLHQCPVHGGGVPHPETEEPGDTPFDFDAHRLNGLRNAFRVFRYTARRNGFTGDASMFEEACLAEVGAFGASDMTPQRWVDAAEQFAERVVSDASEARARRHGYSCALEQRWEEAAEMERMERLHGGYWEA